MKSHRAHAENSITSHQGGLLRVIKTGEAQGTCGREYWKRRL